MTKQGQTKAATVDTSSYIKLYFKSPVDSISLDMSTIADSTRIKIVVVPKILPFQVEVSG